jgi:hypothetical protein
MTEKDAIKLVQDIRKEKETAMLYPANEDIYEQSENAADVDPEDLSKTKSVNTDDAVGANEKDGSDGKPGGDLDVPGAELDDEQEEIGSEDEENNYYSIGGDDHNDLDEDGGID